MLERQKLWRTCHNLKLKLESGISISDVNIFKMNPSLLARIKSQCLNKSKENWKTNKVARGNNLLPFFIFSNKRNQGWNMRLKNLCLLMLKTCWSNIYSWIMVEFMHVKVVIVASNYFALTSDEITTIDNVSWISVHAYMIVD